MARAQDLEPLSQLADCKDEESPLKSLYRITGEDRSVASCSTVWSSGSSPPTVSGPSEKQSSSGTILNELHFGIPIGYIK